MMIMNSMKRGDLKTHNVDCKIHLAIKMKSANRTFLSLLILWTLLVSYSSLEYRSSRKGTDTPSAQAILLLHKSNIFHHLPRTSASTYLIILRNDTHSYS